MKRYILGLTIVPFLLCFGAYAADYADGKLGQALILEPASKKTATRTFQVDLIPDAATKTVQYTGQPLELKF